MSDCQPILGPYRKSAPTAIPGWITVGLMAAAAIAALLLQTGQ